MKPKTIEKRDRAREDIVFILNSNNGVSMTKVEIRDEMYLCGWAGHSRPAITQRLRELVREGRVQRRGARYNAVHVDA